MEKINRIIIEIPVTLIRIYQFLVSPLIGQNCRFTPTCSQYSIESLRQHGIVYGLYLPQPRALTLHVPIPKVSIDHFLKPQKFIMQLCNLD